MSNKVETFSQWWANGAHVIYSRILFLDFDGVLNNRRSLMRQGIDAIDRDCVAHLQSVYDRTGCAVVVSSTWRLTRTVRELARILEGNGYTGPVIDATPELPDRYRGREIYQWMGQHAVPACRIAIVDDDSDMDHLLPRHVKTEFEVGLTADGADALVALLRSAGPARVQRRRCRGARLPAGVKYVGRPGPWGNPFRPDRPRGDWTDADPIAAYRAWVREFPRALAELRGKDLACWCSPVAPCHVDVLLELANA